MNIAYKSPMSVINFKQQFFQSLEILRIRLNPQKHVVNILERYLRYVK